MAKSPRKALFTAQPLHPHLRPHVPLIKAFEAHGFKVKLAAPDRLAEPARLYGVEHVRAGVDWTADPAIRGEVARLLLEEGNDAFNNAWFAHLANGARSMAPDVEDIVEEWRPDVIVTDISEFAGYLVGKKTGTPVITSDNGLARLVRDLHDPVIRPILNEVARDMGLGPEPEGVPGSFQTLLSPAPQRLLLPDVDFKVVPFRHENPRAEDERLPDGVFQNPDHKNMYVMYGHTGSEFPQWQPIFERSYRTTIDAMANQPYDVLMVVGKGNVGKYADLPVLEEELERDQAMPARGAPNIMVVAETAQPLGIEQADLVGHHCGFGTTREVHLADPKPSVFMPNQTDQPDNARMLAAHGLGRRLDPRTVTAEEFRATVEELVARSDEIMADHAPFQQAMQELPSVPELTESVERALEVGDLEFRGLKEPPADPGAVSGAPFRPRPDGPITITGPAGAAADPQQNVNAEADVADRPYGGIDVADASEPEDPPEQQPTDLEAPEEPAKSEVLEELAEAETTQEPVESEVRLEDPPAELESTPEDLPAEPEVAVVDLPVESEVTLVERPAEPEVAVVDPPAELESTPEDLPAEPEVAVVDLPVESEVTLVERPAEPEPTPEELPAEPEPTPEELPAEPETPEEQQPAQLEEPEELYCEEFDGP